MTYVISSLRSAGNKKIFLLYLLGKIWKFPYRQKVRISAIDVLLLFFFFVQTVAFSLEFLGMGSWKNKNVKKIILSIISLISFIYLLFFATVCLSVRLLELELLLLLLLFQRNFFRFFFLYKRKILPEIHLNFFFKGTYFFFFSLIFFILRQS